MSLLGSPIITSEKNRHSFECLDHFNFLEFNNLNGHVDILKYLEQICRDNPIEEFKQMYSDYLDDNNERDMFSQKFKILKLFECSCLHDLLEIAAWIYLKTKFLSEPSYRSSIICLFHETIREGHLKISKWLFRTFSIKKTETKSSILYVYNDCLVDASTYDHVEVVKWLLSVFEYEWNEIQSEIKRKWCLQKCPQDVQKNCSFFS